MKSASIFREVYEMKRVSSLTVLVRQIGQWHEKREQPQFPILAEYEYKGTKITGTFGLVNRDVVDVDVKTYEIDPEMLKPHVEKLLSEGASFQTYQGEGDESRPMTWTIEYIAENIYELARHIIAGVNPIQYGDRSILRANMPEGSHVDLSSHNPLVTEQEIMPHVLSLINRGKHFTLGTNMMGSNPRITIWSIEYTAKNATEVTEHVLAGHAPIIFRDGRKILMASAPPSVEINVEAGTDTIWRIAALSCVEIMLDTGAPFVVRNNTDGSITLWSMEPAGVTQPLVP